MIMNIIFNHLHDHHEYCFKPSLVVINIMNYWQEIKMDDEIKCAPWNTSRAYVQVLTENNISFIMEIHWLLDSLRVQMIDQTFESADPVY